MVAPPSTACPPRTMSSAPGTPPGRRRGALRISLEHRRRPMAEYVPPLRDMKFVIEELADLEGVGALPGLEEATADLVEAVLTEAGRFAANVLSPINRTGDLQGARLDGDGVVTADGWKEAYRALVDGGWASLSFDPDYGGQGLPWLVSAAVQEMQKSANLAFGL